MSGSGRRAADYQSSFLFAISVFTLSLHVPDPMTSIEKFDNHNDTKRPGTSHGESPEAAKFERELDTIPEESETEEEPPAKPTEISKTVYYNIPAVVINDATI